MSTHEYASMFILRCLSGATVQMEIRGSQATVNLTFRELNKSGKTLDLYKMSELKREVVKLYLIMMEVRTGTH